MPFIVYVLLNPERKTYVGQTCNLPRRLSQHNDPDCRLTLHTKRHPGPWKLLYFEEFATRAAAMRREKELKAGKGRDWIRQVLLRGC
jgi:putative endonuclease